MFDLKKSNAHDIFKRHLVPLYVIFGLLVLNGRALVSATGRIRPSHQDFAISELTAAQKEKFLDEHNKFRGMVDPPAADMEYLVSILSFSYLGNWCSRRQQVRQRVVLKCNTCSQGHL